MTFRRKYRSWFSCPCDGSEPNRNLRPNLKSQPVRGKYLHIRGKKYDTQVKQLIQLFNHTCQDQLRRTPKPLKLLLRSQWAQPCSPAPTLGRQITCQREIFTPKGHWNRKMGYDTIESSIDLPARMAGNDTRAPNNSPVDGSMQDGEVLS